MVGLRETRFGNTVLRRLFWVLLLGFVASSAFARALEIRGLVLTVSDLPRAVAFYESALGFTRVSERIIADPRHDYAVGVFGTRVLSATLRLSDETVELQQYLAPAGQPIPGDSRSNDLWFQHFAIVVSDMDRAHARLKGFGVQSISTAPQTIPESNVAAAGIRAYKFKDPDGHPLELLQFPLGKGNPKWQRGGERLFLGIDHSAIAVADTQRSLAFYRDLIGLAVAGESLNSGPTQEHLDGSFGAVLRVTSLRPERATGPGLEFLHYLTPSGGRPAPASLLPNDIAHVRVVLEVDDLERLAQRLTERLARFVSPSIVELAGEGRGLLVKDPDGHALMLVQRAP